MSSEPTRFLGLGASSGATPISPVSAGGDVPDFLSSFLPDTLKGNPYFEAGFGLSLLGTGLALARGASTVAVNMTKRHFLVTLEITSKDRSYPWVLAWLTRQASSGNQIGSSYGSTLAQHVSVVTSVGASSSVAGVGGGGGGGGMGEGGASAVNFEFAPCPGRHFVTYGGRVLMVDRTRAEQSMMDMNTGLPFETVKLVTLGRSRSVFEKLLTEASHEALEKERHHTVVFKSWGSEWHPFGKPRLRRPLSSVILEAGVSEGVLDDFNQFASSRQWYTDRGIPYRRGYLLHGPPGSGKTSFITALAGELGFDICVLNVGEAGLTDDRLATALSNMPPKAFALLEDVDAAFTQRLASDTSQSRSYVTFSGLLNALDGVAAGEERVVFMTTNHLERLDPALIRPGRADMLRLIGDATPEQASRMFLKFYPNEHESAAHFATALETLSEGGGGHGAAVSMALLQGFFMTHRDDGPLGALQATAALVEEAREIAALKAVMAEHQSQGSGLVTSK